MQPAPRHADARIQQLVHLYETLAPQDLLPQGRLAQIYRADARFKDPFNQVQGLPAITAIFEHMFRTLDNPRFQVLQVVAEGDDAFLTWDFSFGRPAQPGGRLRIHGASHVKFAADGQIHTHRDYWDAAEELYEKLPWIGALMRWLKRRAAG